MLPTWMCRLSVVSLAAAAGSSARSACDAAAGRCAAEQADDDVALLQGQGVAGARRVLGASEAIVRDAEKHEGPTGYYSTQAAEASCAVFGCGPFQRGQKCQCDKECSDNDNCCTDYKATCVPRAKPVGYETAPTQPVKLAPSGYAVPSPRPANGYYAPAPKPAYGNDVPPPKPSYRYDAPAPSAPASGPIYGYDAPAPKLDYGYSAPAPEPSFYGYDVANPKAAM